MNAKRLDKLEQHAAARCSTVVSHEAKVEAELQRRRMDAIVADGDSHWIFRTLCGMSYEEKWGGPSFIPDEKKIEAALREYEMRYDAIVAAEGPQAVAAEAARRERRKREGKPMLSLSEERSQFIVDAERFASVSIENCAVALRFINARKRRHRDEEQEAEYHAALAVFQPRFEAFLAAERKGSGRRGRTKARTAVGATEG